MKKLTYLLFFFSLITNAVGSKSRLSLIEEPCDLEITIVNEEPYLINQTFAFVNSSPINPNVAYYKWSYIMMLPSNNPDETSWVIKDTILPVEDTLFLTYSLGGFYEVTLRGFDDLNEELCSVKTILDVQDNNGCQTNSPNCEFVCNGDFESFDAPIDHYSDYSSVDGSGSNGFTFYHDATVSNAWVNFVGSTDIFSSNNAWDGIQPSCNGATNAIDVPSNFAGSQPAYSGNSYCGIFAFSNGTYSNAGYREYILQRLSAPLIAGETYFVSYAVSLADLSTYAIDNIDLAFGHGPLISVNGAPSPNSNQFSLYNYTGNHNDNLLAYSFSSGLPPQITPDIANPFGILSNTNSWIVISGIYVAAGDEKMLAIGNFYADNQTPASMINSNTCLNDRAYYYIDDVKVMHILQPINLTASSTSVCYGQSVTLTSNPGFDNYIWSTGQSGTTLNSIVVNPATTTTYTLTVFDPVCGSTISENITIVVNPLPNASAGSDVSLCGYGCDLFDGSGGVSYFWSPILGLNDPSLENPEICGPNVAPFYTVTVTDANGCQDTDVVNVTVTPANFPPPAITGPSNLCCADLTFSVPLGFDFYEWEVPSGITFTSNSTGNSITLDYVFNPNNFVGEQICVYVTDPQGCVQQSCISLERCCGGVGEPISSTVSDLCQPSYLSELVANHGWQNVYNNTTLHIQNDLIVDQNLTLNLSTINIDAERKIIIKPGVTLTIDKSILQNYCDYMWEGIVLENSLCSLTVTNGSLITQAKNAVVSNDGGKYTLFNSKFKNNFKSVVVNSYNAIHGGQIGQCNIFGTPNGMVQPHNTDYLPKLGVEINKVKEITIGTTLNASWTNSFQRLRYGIESNESNIYVYNNSFSNITSFPSPIANLISNDGAIAIWVKNGHSISPTQFVNIGNTSTGTNKFDQCKKGIQVQGSITSNIIGNTFENNQITNIFCKKTDGKAINILNNTISGRFGIGVLCLDFLKSIVQVKNNSIYEDVAYNHVPSYLNAGIWLANVVPNASLYQIENNQIYRCENGIIADGLPTVLIKNNSVVYSRNNTQIINLAEMHRGIWVKNSKDCEVSLNTIGRSNPNPANNGTLALTSYLRGITVELSPESYVHDNNMQQMGYGMRWVGGSMNSTISCNIMQRCYNGVYFDNAEIGNQGNATNPSGNYWVNNQDSQGDMAGTMNTNANPVTNWYAVLGIPNTIPTDPNPSSVNFPDITILAASGNANCQIAPGGTNPGPIGPVKREALFGSIVRDEKLFIAYADESRMNNRKYLYNVLKNDPSIMTLGSPDDADYHNFFATVATENEGKIEEINLLIADTNYAVAANINASIQVSIVAEENQKTLNEIYLSTWAMGIEIDTNQFIILEAIACQSPLDGGSAVYGARIMIGLDYECANGENRSMSLLEESLIEEIPGDFSIYPNPSSGQFTLLNHVDELIEGKVEIIDITGKMVAVFQLNDTDETQINIIDLPDGLYHYLIYSSDSLIFSNKFVISK